MASGFTDIADIGYTSEGEYLMKIVDINGKEKEAKYVKKVKHKIYDQINEQYIEEEYVEALIVGKKFKWKEYYPLDEFKKMNPGVEI